MNSRHLAADLVAVRALVADGSRALDRATSGNDNMLVAAARARLTVADRKLVMAAVGRTGSWRAPIDLVAGFLIAWGAAASAQAIGFAGAWVIVTTVIVVTAAAAGLHFAWSRVVARLSRHRLARAAPASRPFRVVVDVRGQFTAVPEPIFAARVRLVSAILRQVDAERWQAAWLARLAASRTAIMRMAEADRDLCQAIDLLESYLAARARDAPDQADQDQDDRHPAAQDQADQDQAAQDQADQDQADRDPAARDQAGRDRIAEDQDRAEA